MDHANARFLAEGLARIPGIQMDPAKVETNIVVFDIGGTGLAPAEVSARLRQRGVLMNAINRALSARRDALRCGPRAMRAGGGGGGRKYGGSMAAAKTS